MAILSSIYRDERQRESCFSGIYISSYAEVLKNTERMNFIMFDFLGEI